MTISAVDTYFGDRFAGDFEQKFHTLEEEPLGNILAAVFQIGSDGFERTKFARALQHSEPSGEVVRLFRVRADQQTYQEPGVIAQEAKRFGVRNLWGDVDHRWRRIYGSSIRCESRFRDWAGRRHAIAHRAGRSRKAQRARSTAEHVSGDEARDCVNFFARLISLVDYQLNNELYRSTTASTPERDCGLRSRADESTTHLCATRRRKSRGASTAFSSGVELVRKK